MLVYRIVHKTYSQSLQASGLEGRWNREGNKVLYAAESIALAFLESMLRRKGLGFNDDFRILFIEVPDGSPSRISESELPVNWRNTGNYIHCQVLGNRWYDNRKSLLLRVPSAVLPQSFNYIINTLHADYGQVKLLEVTKLMPDPRIEELLKRYS